MLQAINTKILLSAAVILAAAAVIVGATFAFFADTETSTANTLAAGELDLKIDSTAHYAGLICTVDGETSTWEEEENAVTTRPDLVGEPCEGTWSETDLDESNVFFALSDIKPGDSGENTISLHVYDNDAWGRMVVTTTADSDNDCTEPETESTDVECSQDPIPSPAPGDGELREALLFTAWLDQGSIAGFQCNNPDVPATAGAGCDADTGEGDNIRQESTEPIVISEGEIDALPENETFEFASGLAAIYDAASCSDVDGNTGYALCHGLADDGRMVGSTTYYMGVSWTLPGEAGNEVQSDSFMANVSFDALQHRNNPTPEFE